MTLQKTWRRVPEGEDPQGVGDCVSPKRLTINIYEDRWGNHIIDVYKDGKHRNQALGYSSGSPPWPETRRMPFHLDGDDIAEAIRAVEREDHEKENP